MVAYHDDEWGVPTHDDIELFERLALESFQAGLSWSTILNKRDAFREAFRGFDPRVVADFDDADRARLMADAGIVRNRAKIDATIGNAAAFLATAAEFGSFDAYLDSMVPSPPARMPASATAGEIPATTPGVGRAVGRPEAARLPVRRLDDRLRVHAERGPGRRPPAGLLPLRRDTLAVTRGSETPGQANRQEGVQPDDHDRLPALRGRGTVRTRR